MLRTLLRERKVKRFLTHLSSLIDECSMIILEEHELDPFVKEVTLASFSDLHDFATWRITGHHKNCECWEE